MFPTTTDPTESDLPTIKGAPRALAEFQTDLAPTTLALEVNGLTKRFGSVLANDDVSFKIVQGTIHGIIGENGAGKSTAMKMLYGLYTPDSGEIRVWNQVRKWRSPADAIHAGIGMVHQHFMLADPSTVLDNIILGQEPFVSSHSRFIPRFFRPIDRYQALSDLQTIAKRYGLEVPWDSKIENLSVGIQQRVEILKLLYRKAEILILDEPTAVLTPQEVEALFLNLKRLRDEGKTIVIITHKLKEVLVLTDRVTVFRGGKVSGEVATSQTNEQDLARLMVGRAVNLRMDVSKSKAVKEPALKVRGLTLNSGLKTKTKNLLLNKIQLEVRKGEIVGIAGVEGNGQSELLQLLMNPRRFFKSGRAHAQEFSLFGTDVRNFGGLQIRELEIGFIPEDRHREGLLLDAPLTENFLLGLQRCPHGVSVPLSDKGWVRSQVLRSEAEKAFKEYDVRPADPDLAARMLSGGNQQKLITAREFYRNPQLLIAAQPTRGVDVGAIEFIHKRIVSLRDKGAAILLISSELQEIMTLSDRIHVIFNGQLVKEFARGECTEFDLGLCMGGGEHDPSGRIFN